jgi:hypothetical protein
MSQDQSKLTFAVSRKTTIPIDQVWEVLGDFGTEHRWTKSLLHCERDTPEVEVGTSRICTLPKPLMGCTEVREELVEFSRGRVLTYTLDGPAGPFQTAASRWTTTEDAEGNTVISVEGRFTPKSMAVRLFLWPMVKPYISRVTSNVLGELESFLLLRQQSAKT